MRRKSISQEVEDANKELSSRNIRIEVREVLRYFVIDDGEGVEVDGEFHTVDEALKAAMQP